MALRTRPSPLRARRLLRGVRLYDVAVAIHINEVTLSRAERGERPLAPWLLERLAEYYRTPADKLESEMQRWRRPVEIGRAPQPAPDGPVAA